MCPAALLQPGRANISVELLTRKVPPSSARSVVSKEKHQRGLRRGTTTAELLRWIHIRLEHSHERPAHGWSSDLQDRRPHSVNLPRVLPEIRGQPIRQV